MSVEQRLAKLEGILEEHHRSGKDWRQAVCDKLDRHKDDIINSLPCKVHVERMKKYEGYFKVSFICLIAIIMLLLKWRYNIQLPRLP
jgi:hypothetical protein